MPGGGAKAPRLPAERAAAAVMEGTAGYQGKYGLDPLAGKECSAAGGESAEAHGEAVNTAKRLARVSDSRFGGHAEIQPGALDSG